MSISAEALEAIGAEHEAHELEIRKLQRQRDHFIAANAALIEEKNGLELRLSIANTQHKLAEWQLLQRVLKLEAASDRIANHLTSLPQREEFEILKNDYYAHSARES